MKCPVRFILLLGKYANCTFALVLLLAIDLMTCSDAHASECPKDYLSIHSAFDRAEYVLAGVPQSWNAAVRPFLGVPFKLTHIFKSSSGDLSDGATVYLFNGGLPFTTGMEYIIFAGKSAQKSPGLSLDTGTCQSKNFYEPKNFAAKISDLRDDPEAQKTLLERLGGPRSVTLQGHVTSVDRGPAGQNPLTAETKLGVRVDEVLANLSRDPDPQNEISIYLVGNCSDDFQVGRQYLIFTTPNGRKASWEPLKHEEYHPPPHPSVWGSTCWPGGIETDRSSLLDSFNVSHK